MSTLQEMKEKLLDEVINELRNMTLWRLYQVHFHMLDKNYKMYWVDFPIRRNKKLFLENLEEVVKMNIDKIDEIKEYIDDFWWQPL